MSEGATRRRPPRGRDDAGSSSLEFAVTLLPMLALIFLAVQVSLVMYGANVALHAAKEGVSRARQQPGLATEDAGRATMESSIADFGSQLGGSELTATTAHITYLGDQQRVRVEVTGHVVSLLPLLTFTVHRSAAGELEDFRPDVSP